MKTTSETATLQQHPQASAERAPRQATRKRREREKEEAANNNNNDPDKVSNGKRTARKGFPRRSDDQKSTPVNVSTHITQRRD